MKPQINPSHPETPRMTKQKLISAFVVDLEKIITEQVRAQVIALSEYIIDGKPSKPTTRRKPARVASKPSKRTRRPRAVITPAPIVEDVAPVVATTAPIVEATTPEVI